MKNIVVLVEHLRGEVRDISYEMLGKAQELARATDRKVTALVLGDPTEPIASKVSDRCDNLLVYHGAQLKDFDAEAYQQVLGKFITAERPSLVLIAHSALGVDLAPALAVQTGLPMISDVIEIVPDGKQFRFTRQMYSGKLNAELRLKSDSGIVTVRSSAFRPAAPAASAQVKTVQWTLSGQLRRKFLGYEEAPSTGIDITKASTIVAVGRGIRDQKNLPIVESFAKAIGAEIGCTRPIIDAGWLPKERQIGNSGKTVKPKLYIGLGISGAFQHTIGIKGAETIIAVNKDPAAPIFSVAHYGIVGDILKVVPALEAKIKELKAA
ncbi:MAG: electron transfer flavoprotein subunit alpha/FixB family protein [candidate division WOR-3 bacterium]